MPKERPQRPVRQRPTRSNQHPAHSPGADEDDGYHELISVVRDMLARERLHVPPKLEDNPPELPFDLTKVDDNSLQKLYSAFSAYSYRAGYLLLEHEAVAGMCRRAADEIAAAFLAVNSGDYRTVTAADAAAEQLPDVERWRKRQKLNGVLADAQRKQRDNYDKICERLSRLETMRHQEFERSGQRLASRKK